MKTIKRKLIPALFLGLVMVAFSSCRDVTQTSTTEVKIADSATGREVPPPPPPPPPGRLTQGEYLSQDSLRRYITETKGNISKPGKGIPFYTLHYNKVIAYEFEGNEEHHPSVSENGDFAPVITKQTTLSQPQVDRMTSLLSSNSTYGGAFAACFNPHIALIFYQDTSKVSVINICMACNYLDADPEIPAMLSHKVNAGTKNEYAEFGFSDAGKEALKKFCDELGYVYKR